MGELVEDLHHPVDHFGSEVGGDGGGAESATDHWLFKNDVLGRSVGSTVLGSQGRPRGRLRAVAGRAVGGEVRHRRVVLADLALEWCLGAIDSEFSCPLMTDGDRNLRATGLQSRTWVVCVRLEEGRLLERGAGGWLSSLVGTESGRLGEGGSTEKFINRY